MPKLFIGSSLGSPENKRYVEVPVRDVISQKSLSFYLGCEISDLEKIESDESIERIEKTKTNSKVAVFYKISDFPKFVRGVQMLPVAKDLDFLTSVDTSKKEFEIVFGSGSRMRFVNTE